METSTAIGAVNTRSRAMYPDPVSGLRCAAAWGAFRAILRVIPCLPSVKSRYREHDLGPRLIRNAVQREKGNNRWSAEAGAGLEPSQSIGVTICPSGASRMSKLGVFALACCVLVSPAPLARQQTTSPVTQPQNAP